MDSYVGEIDKFDLSREGIAIPLRQQTLRNERATSLVWTASTEAAEAIEPELVAPVAPIQTKIDVLRQEIAGLISEHDGLVDIDERMTA